MVATWLAVFMQTPTIKVLDPLTNKVNRKFRLIELGGGRGLLMQDIIRSFFSYQINNNFDLNFIESKQTLIKFLNTIAKSSRRTSWMNLRRIKLFSNLTMKRLLPTGKTSCLKMKRRISISDGSQSSKTSWKKITKQKNKEKRSLSPSLLWMNFSMLSQWLSFNTQKMDGGKKCYQSHKIQSKKKWI